MLALTLSFSRTRFWLWERGSLYPEGIRLKTSICGALSELRNARNEFRAPKIGYAATSIPISAFNLIAAFGSTHFTSARKFTSVGLWGLARCMLRKLFATLW